MSAERALLFIDGSNFYHAARDIGAATGDLDYDALAHKLILDRQVEGSHFRSFLDRRVRDGRWVGFQLRRSRTVWHGGHIYREIIARRIGEGVTSDLSFFAGWHEVPDNEPFDNAFKLQWEAYIRHVCEDGPFPWNLLEGAKGVQLAEAGLRSWAQRRWITLPDLDL